MTSALSRLTLTALIAGLLLAGCAHQPATQTTTAATAAAAPSPRSSTSRQHQTATTRSRQAASNTTLPERTDIAACDDYLSSYLACHRAAAIYAPAQLPARYQAMRTSLLRDSTNPDIRPQLASRCNSLASQLRQALHGKSCAENPASVSSSP